MIQKACIIWKNADTDYKPAEKPMDTVSLDDDTDLTGRSIVKFTYKGIEQAVNSWVDAYLKVLRLLHHQDESILTQLAYETDSNVELAIHVSTDIEKVKPCDEIDDGIYIWTGIGTNYKINNLLKFFKMFGEDPQDLIFFLKEDNKDKAESDDKPRHIVRRKYWTYALPEIKEAHNGGCFANVEPAKYTSRAGYWGIGGFKIKCIAKNDKAVVEVLFYKKDAGINKNAFDYLFSYKDEIEAELGKTLIWDRGVNVRYSRIMMVLNDVSIENEADWKLMSRFHAEWSKKFYDVIVPKVNEKFMDLKSDDETDEEDEDLED